MNSEKVILASNNSDLIKALTDCFHKQNICLKHFNCKLSLFEHILLNKPDFLILDGGLQKSLKPSSIVKFLNAHPALLIIYLINNETESQRISLLQAGIDRILNKGISAQEIFSNLSVLLNRKHININPPVDEFLHAPNDHWALNKKGWQLIAPNNRSISLTVREYFFLDCLFQKPGELINKSYLAESVIGKDTYNSHQKLNKVITLLRKKILLELETPLPITTVHTYGYVFHSNAILID